MATNRPPLLTSVKTAPGRNPPPPTNPRSSPTSSAAKKRTSHACVRCRLMRTKCSGGTPCARCAKDDTECTYGDHKRERDKKDLAERGHRVRELEDEINNLTAALRQVTSAPGFRLDGYPDVASLLARYTPEEQVESPQGFQSQSQSLRTPKSDSEARSDKGGEANVPSTVGSPAQQGHLSRIVDLDQGSGAAGFVGQMSEISWMQRCFEYFADRPVVNNTNETTAAAVIAAVADLNYYVDDINLLSVDEDSINPLEWPAPQVAVITAEAYFHATRGSFELLMYEDFVVTMYQFAEYARQPSWRQRKWLAIANLVWAIGSKWLHLAQLDGPDFTDDHVVYYARARALGLDHRITFDHPDLEMVQGLGLLCFYLLINGSISKAWNVVGSAISHAISLGLHMRVTDPSVDELDRHRRARTWYSLYRLQVLITEITGRPQLVRTAYVTVPLDILGPPVYVTNSDAMKDRSTGPVAAARRTWSDYLSIKFAVSPIAVIEHMNAIEFPRVGSAIAESVFVYYIRLCQLCEEIADNLYTGHQDLPWSQTQAKIEELQQGLDAWTGTLPDELKLSENWQSDPNAGVSIQLLMYSYSVTMILHRPCLTEIRIKDESQQSKEFNQLSARSCVDAAISMLAFLPETFVAHKVYQLLPWWVLLHYICQAMSILLLELCLDSQHYDGKTALILNTLWRTMSFLACMTEESKSAYKAWRVFDSFCQRVILRLGTSHTNVHNYAQAPRPPQWSAEEENSLLAALRSY